ncbi:immunoglobulin lambda-1 light chain-like [Syngnathoides biaculeatus]|uniref:immunoglobulin lambda-1 light chain-like n=1 Tax=Syngnathoides biaculeatus TaxID=300417 RepID=UPI002ADD9790|nr:immunoglobulin lambda-1 light chain-like [Syngnathoides biaculeatus]
MLGTLCLLVCALTYGHAAKVLTQTPPSLTVPVGREVVLNCNIQTAENYYVFFFRQIDGEAPEFILRYYHSHSKPNAFGSGFSSSRFDAKASSPVDYQFVIKQAEAGDSAEYYCLTWDNSTQENVSQRITVVFGGGTKLLVTSPDAAPPTVTLFPPAGAELQSKEATLVCVATQSSPYPDVTWLAGGLPARGAAATAGAAVRQADGAYKISSYLTVQTSDWNADTSYTCKVSLGSRFAEKTINKSKCAA